MQRLQAGFVAVLMLLTSGSAVPRHVHLSADHDHAEHQHGVADHLHLAAAHAPHAEPGADHAPQIEQIERCDPGTHAVSVALVCASLEAGHQLEGLAVDSLTLLPRQSVRANGAPDDVRGHGPPLSRRSPPRAPPLVDHA